MKVIRSWVMMALLLLSLVMPLGKPAYGATLESMLSTLDQATYGTIHSENGYREPLDILSQRCTENRMKIGDWAVTGTKLLREKGGNIDNYHILNSVVGTTEGRTHLSCKEEFQAYSTLMLFDLLHKS